jgi:hypothetical protein
MNHYLTGFDLRQDATFDDRQPQQLCAGFVNGRLIGKVFASPFCKSSLPGTTTVLAL